MSSENKVFYPPFRVLTDVLLMTNVGLFILAVMANIPNIVLTAVVVLTNVFHILFWLFVIRPLLKVELRGTSLIGPTTSLRRITIPLRKIDHKKTSVKSTGFHRWFFKEVWSIDNTVICMFRKFLGERQVTEVMATIEKYPFREGV